MRRHRGARTGIWRSSPSAGQTRTARHDRRVVGGWKAPAVWCPPVLPQRRLAVDGQEAALGHDYGRPSDETSGYGNLPRPPPHSVKSTQSFTKENAPATFTPNMDSQRDSAPNNTTPSHASTALPPLPSSRPEEPLHTSLRTRLGTTSKRGPWRVSECRRDPLA